MDYGRTEEYLQKLSNKKAPYKLTLNSTLIIHSFHIGYLHFIST